MEITKLGDWKTNTEAQLTHVTNLLGYIEREIQDAIEAATAHKTMSQFCVTIQPYLQKLAPLIEIDRYLRQGAAVYAMIGALKTIDKAIMRRIITVDVNTKTCRIRDMEGRESDLPRADKSILMLFYIEVGG